jgi:MFS family permease
MNIHTSPPPPLSATGRYLVLTAAFLGWLCAGTILAITSLAMQPAAIDLLGRTAALDPVRYHALNRQEQGKDATSTLPLDDRKQLGTWREMVARWFAWYQCAFLFGAATGGLCFGWLGDHIGRVKGMAASIFTYSAMAGLAGLVQSPSQLLVVWFLASMGVGGMWPNGVALVAEAWSTLSRPLAAGLIGTSANIGILLFATLAAYVAITPDEWRWVMLLGVAPLVLALVILVAVPESPRWLGARGQTHTGSPGAEVFRPPLLPITLVGITLATIPMIGAWGSANWMVPWAGVAGEATDPPDPFLKAYVSQARALTGIIGSLLGGWIGSVLGRRRSYVLVSFLALLVAQYTFWFSFPTADDFLFWVAVLGFLSGFFFGWLPLFLPELFPTRARSTGAGVSFNFGRIITAVTIFATGALMAHFAGDFARIGRLTSLIYAAGLLVPWLAPDTSGKQIQD